MDIPFSDPGAHAAGERTMHLAKSILNRLNVPFWLSAGTLLGAIREHDFIPHDSDIDLGIWDDAPDHERICRTFVAHNFRFVAEYGKEGQPGHQYSFWSPYGTYVDLFFHVREADRCWLPLWVSGECKKCVYPPITGFVECPFLGETFPIPANYEEILVAQYGAEWRTPVAPIERGGEWRWDSSAKNLEDHLTSLSTQMAEQLVTTWRSLNQASFRAEIKERIRVAIAKAVVDELMLQTKREMDGNA